MTFGMQGNTGVTLSQANIPQPPYFHKRFNPAILSCLQCSPVAIVLGVAGQHLPYSLHLQADPGPKSFQPEHAGSQQSGPDYVAYGVAAETQASVRYSHPHHSCFYLKGMKTLCTISCIFIAALSTPLTPIGGSIDKRRAVMLWASMKPVPNSSIVSHRVVKSCKG